VRLAPRPLRGLGAEPHSIPKVGREPTPCCQDQILSPVRLPLPRHWKHVSVNLEHLIDVLWEIERQINRWPNLTRLAIIPDGSTRRYNRCTSPAQWIRHETHIRYHLPILPLFRRVQTLLHLQTVNAQKNLEQDFKSNLHTMIRSDSVRQTA